MCGEVEFAGSLVERFASFHRQNYGGCKGGVADIIIGATATIADYNGAAKAAHVKTKLLKWFILLKHCTAALLLAQLKDVRCLPALTM